MALRRGGAHAVNAGKPTCNPCREDEHGRCAQVLGHAYLGVIDSDYRCACYARDEQGHKTDADERQEAHRDSYEPQHLGYYASQRREYQKWAEEL